MLSTIGKTTDTPPTGGRPLTTNLEVATAHEAVPPDQELAEVFLRAIGIGGDAAASFSVGHPRKSHLRKRVKGSFRELLPELAWAAGQGAGIHLCLENNMVMIGGRVGAPVPENWRVQPANNTGWREHDEGDPVVVLQFSNGSWRAIWAFERPLTRVERLTVRRRLEAAYGVGKSSSDPTFATVLIPGFEANHSDGALVTAELLYNPQRAFLEELAPLETVIKAHPVPDEALMDTHQRRLAAKAARERRKRQCYRNRRAAPLAVYRRPHAAAPVTRERRPPTEVKQKKVRPLSGAEPTAKKGPRRKKDYEKKYTSDPWRRVGWIRLWQLSRSGRISEEGWVSFALWRPQSGEHRRHVFRLSYNGERFADSADIRALEDFSEGLFTETVGEIISKHRFWQGTHDDVGSRQHGV